MPKMFVGSVRIGKESVNIFLAAGSMEEAKRFLTRQECRGKEVTSPELEEVDIYEECLPSVKRALECTEYHNAEHFFKE